MAGSAHTDDQSGLQLFLTMMLTAESYDRAREFLRQQARPLERALYCYHFGCAYPVDAREALAEYQNRDGGFGRALEPDIRVPASSAIATTVGFHYLREFGVTAADPLVPAAVRWTQDAFDPKLERWLPVPAAVDLWPHAPWWSWREPGAPGFALNPGIELVAHLWHYAEAADAAFLARVTDAAEAFVDTLPQKLEMHDLLCLVRLAETPSVPAVLRNKAADQARRSGPAVVARDPQAWSGYAAKPLLLAPRADSLLAPLLRDAIDANLDYEIKRQGADGAWAPNWDWQGRYPDRWPEAELEWKSVLTLQVLLSLRSYGRLPAVSHDASAPAYSFANG